MTEWVAIFRESGLQADVTIANLQDACLKIVDLTRARACELQVDLQVERAQQPLSAKTAIPTTKSKPKPAAETNKPVFRFFLKPDGRRNGDNCHVHILAPMECLRCGSEAHNLPACTRPRRQQSSRSSSAKPAPKKTYAKPKGKTADAQVKTQGSPDKKKGKGKSKGKDRKSKPSAKSGDVDFDEDVQAETDEQEAEDAAQDKDPEAYLVEAQTSESEVESDDMLDWLASERKDYKDRAFATVACLSHPDSPEQLSDTWEWRGPWRLVRVHRQLRRCLYTPTWKKAFGKDSLSSLKELPM